MQRHDPKAEPPTSHSTRAHDAPVRGSWRRLAIDSGALGPFAVGVLALLTSATLAAQATLPQVAATAEGNASGLVAGFDGRSRQQFLFHERVLRGLQGQTLRGIRFRRDEAFRRFVRRLDQSPDGSRANRRSRPGCRKRQLREQSTDEHAGIHRASQPPRLAKALRLDDLESSTHGLDSVSATGPLRPRPTSCHRHRGRSDPATNRIRL